MQPADITELREIEPDQARIDDQELHTLYLEAKKSLTRNTWCRGIVRAHHAYSADDLFGLFHFEIIGDDAPTNWWSIAGDVPPALIRCDICHTARDAILGYVGELKYWAEGAAESVARKDAMPVLRRGSFQPVEASPEMADLVRRRIKLIQEVILPDFENSRHRTP